MIVAIGVDVIEVWRIKEVLARRGNRFRNRVYTEAEISYCEERSSRIESYAVRFAAKEAMMKALGTGWAEGVRWRDIEVVRLESGPPMINLTGRALERFHQLGANRIHLSLAHSRDVAMAEVIIESISTATTGG
jgi:holo-[acyl-carrier protein] synthase